MATNGWVKSIFCALPGTRQMLIQREQAEEERQRRVRERVNESNNTMRAISDVALELRASADRLEDVLNELHPSDFVATPFLVEVDEDVLTRTRDRLDRLIQALEEERKRL